MGFRNPIQSLGICRASSARQSPGYFRFRTTSRFHFCTLREAPIRAVWKKLLIAFALSLSLSASAQSNRELGQLFSILRVAMAENGYLTPQMHSEFWRVLRKTATAPEIDTFQTSFAPALIWAQKYQLTLWESARISSQRREIFRSQELREMQSKLPSKFDEWSSGLANSPVYAAALESWKKDLTQSLANADKLLEAAATGSQMNVPTMPPMPITEQYIVRVLERIDGSFSRVRNLVNPDWTPK